MRFGVCFSGCFGGSTKTRCLQGILLRFRLRESCGGLATAQARRDIVEDYQESFRLSPGFHEFAMLWCRMIQCGANGDRPEDYRETFRLSPGFVRKRSVCPRVFRPRVFISSCAECLSQSTM